MRPQTAKGVLRAISLACFLASCSTALIHERYHVRGVRLVPGVRDAVVQNYYRVEVNGRIRGTKLRYLSGFFDVDAIDRYFNTFTQPENGALLSVTTPDGKPAKDPVPEDEMRDADPRGLGRKLVLILSQNSEAVADQIGAIAQSEEFATIAGRLIFRDELAQLEGMKVESDRLAGLADEDRDAGVDLADQLRNMDDAGQTKEKLLLFVNRVAAPLGGGGFKSFEKAITWLQENRVKLLRTQ